MKNDKQFIGCYAKDKLPKKLSKLNPKKLVINTSSSMNKGEHWVAIILMNKNECFYFDSFGIKIIDEEVLQFLSKQKHKSYTFNAQCIQHFMSTKCGQFCIKFLRNVNSKKDFYKFLSKFDFYDLKKNDEIVNNI